MKLMPQLDQHGLRFHHLGLAVKMPEQSIRFLEALGYTIGPHVSDPLQNVNLIMCSHQTMPDVEIIFPGIGPGPVDRLLQQHSDGLVYHMCYECDNLAATMASVKESGAFRLACISPPKPAVLFDGKPVSFYIVTGVGLIEIIDNARSQSV